QDFRLFALRKSRRLGVPSNTIRARLWKGSEAGSDVREIPVSARSTVSWRTLRLSWLALVMRSEGKPRKNKIPSFDSLRGEGKLFRQPGNPSLSAPTRCMCTTAGFRDPHGNSFSVRRSLLRVEPENVLRNARK